MKRSLYTVAGLLFLGLALNGMTVNGQTVGIATPAGVQVEADSGIVSTSGDGQIVATAKPAGLKVVTAGEGGGGGGGGQPSDQGLLYGDLYVIARYMGGETKKVPQVDANGLPVMTAVKWIDENGLPVICLGGLPCVVQQQAWTTAIAVGGEPKLTEKFATYTVLDENGVPEINPLTGDIYFLAPYPSQCVQPVADSVRWGDISSKTGLDENRLPLDYIYDATHSTTECAVTDALFIEASPTVPETWDYGTTDTGDDVTYYKNISYPELIQEVSFGRLSLARSPEVTHDQAFDEAITNLNNARQIILDATGRLVMITDVYDEFLTDEDGNPLFLETVTKTIDSPRENLAFYIKLMKDGHLITPASERAPLDMSAQGGSSHTIEDGPSTALRPTIDIAKMEVMGLGNLVDAANITTYYAKYVKNDVGGGAVVICTSDFTGCEQYTGTLAPSAADACLGNDLPFSATFLASAADKSGTITMDEIVYLNSILGINQVVGLSDDGTIDYSKSPVYFNYATNPYAYNRETTFEARGQAATNPDGSVIIPVTYDGNVRVILGGEVDGPTPGVWTETVVPIFPTIFNSVAYTGTNISGFTTMADDNVHAINYIHTYQIPGLR